ncbi:MAG: histidine kinase [Clostridiales bacterium]|nr:histidine kinase [Clostridiales bacterium]
MQPRSSAIRRTATLIILIELILLAVFAFQAIRFGAANDRSEAAAREELLQNSAEQLHTVVNAAIRMAENLAADDRMNQLAYHSYLSEYDRSRIILGLITNLKNMQGMYPVVDNIQILFPKEEMALDSTSGYNNQKPYEPPSEEELHLSPFMYYEGGVLKLRIQYPLITAYSDSMPDYACEFRFSSDILKSYLPSTSGNTGCCLLVQDPEGTWFPLDMNEDNEIPSLADLPEQIKVEGIRCNVYYVRIGEQPLAIAYWQPSRSLSRSMTAMLISLVSIVLLTGLLLMFLLYRANKDIAVPIRRLISAFDQVRAGDLSTRIQHNKNDEFSLIYESFNNMSDRTEQLIEDIKEQHTLLQNAELAQLQAQIDPHFLYNSFNMIKYMAEGEEYEQISETVSNLAEYYRFINKETRQAIPLQAEVRHMETYLYIQQLRFEGRIQLDDGQLPAQAAGFKVPKLILQPLVENCYKHGLKNKLQDGLIQIRYRIEGDRLTLSIADNGGEMTEEKLEEARKHMYDTNNQSISHALSNTRRRLELAFGDPDMIALSINEDQGLTVALRFDLTKTAEG